MYLSHLKTLVLKKIKGVIPMSGAPRVLSMNDADLEARSVLAPAGNKAGLLVPVRKAVSKHLGKVESALEVVKKQPQLAHHFVNDSSPLLAASPAFPSILQRREQILHSNLSLSASCSSDASSDSVQSRASTGRIGWSNPARHKKKQCAPKTENVFQDSISVSSQESVQTTRKKCAWVTPNTDPVYAAFHDEEWGVPVHDDKKLFELLVLSGALAELPWPAILRKRHIFREIFLDFDHASVAKLNEKKLVTPGSTPRVLLSEPKLRGVVENARQISKILEEFGSFDKYCWSFVNHKPIISKFRYPRQVPVKTPKADVISKDLVKRGFRCVGPTVVYSFMQAAGITNDHLITCDRFDECVAAASRFKDDAYKAKADEEKPVEDTGKKEDVDDTGIIGLDRDMDELGFLQ